MLLHLFYPRTVLPPDAVVCIRALSCRVLLGMARDDTIAYFLTEFQVGKLLSELLRDCGSQAGHQGTVGGIGGEQGRWQAELSRVPLELIAVSNFLCIHLRPFIALIMSSCIIVLDIT